MFVSKKFFIKANRAITRLIAGIIISSVALQTSPAMAEEIGNQARQTFNSTVSFIRNNSVKPRQVEQDFQTERVEDSTERAARISKVRFCPRRLTLYVGEDFTLVPVPVDGNNEPVHGVSFVWETSNAKVAAVSSWGEISAIAAGKAFVSAQVGNKHGKIMIDVLEGVRPVQSDQESDMARANDCDESVSSASESSQTAAFDVDNIDANATRRYLKPAMLRNPSQGARRAATVAVRKYAARPYLLPDPIDGDSEDTFAGSAELYTNAIGSPRFTPQQTAEVGVTKTRKNLGSYNYSFSAPVSGLAGRGLGVSLVMAYNGQLWTKDGSTMTFNYNKGWPAAGWSLGYGRIIKNYDNTAAGNGTGVGVPNAPGNRLLLQPDGTRVHLQQVYSTTEGVWKWDSNDGTFLHLARNNKLKYPDGTVIKYDEPSNRLVPTSVKTRNGDLITIAYRSKTSTFKYRWAIDFIKDSLGRIITFRYYGDKDVSGNYIPGYEPNDALGRPDGALAAVLAPDFSGGQRVMVRFEYQSITINYDFGSMTVSAPAKNTTLSVIKRIYYPQTGRGYLFSDYSTYGMARYISVRKDMTGPGGTFGDGSEVAYTKYYYTTINPSDPYGRHQSGALNDSPQYTREAEWWLGKTDNVGNPDPNPTYFDFERVRTTDASGFSIEIDKTKYINNNFEIWTTTGNDPANMPDLYGRVISVEQKTASGTVLSKTLTTYVNGPDGGGQVGSVETFQNSNEGTKVEYAYENYGRVKNIYEYGFKHSGNYKVRRRTRFLYSDDIDHLNANLLRLVREERIYETYLDNDNTNDKTVAKTVYLYDDYAAKGGMETYGLTSGTYPDTHDAGFDQTAVKRGNVTGTQTWSNLDLDTYTTRYTKYDVFGNVLEADVSCCLVKSAGFSATHLYSQPDWVREGNSGGPNLTTSFQYNFYTGLATRVTDPDGLNAIYEYDNAARLLRVTGPTGSIVETQFDRDAYQNDQLAYSEKLTYSDNGTKTITTKKWLDGAGRVIRDGTGAGSSPASFDLAATKYDSLGRLLMRSNPYSGDSSGNGSPQYWATNRYDSLSRIDLVTLPDSQTIQTAYSGATSTAGPTVVITDQVGRQRKSELDGMGRLMKVTEQNPATGVLDLVSAYSYDTLNNLTGIDQGGQTRAFQYDAFGRMTSQTTPEAGAVTYTYNSFGAVQTLRDARGVVTTFGYDALNRLQTVSYNTSGAPNVASTPGVTMSYRTSSPAKGKVNTITDAGGTESYLYDSLGRLQSKTRTIDSRSYTTGYVYNDGGQLTTLIYPSGKRVRINRDSRGRTSGVDKVDGSGNTMLSYLSGINYRTDGLVSGFNLGNGVSESFEYSPQRLQMTRQRATKGAATLLDLNYSYQAVAGASGAGTTAGNTGQLMSVMNSPSSTINGQARHQTFTYDNLDRLATATGWGTWARRYSYDRWGNRTGQWDATSGGNQLQNTQIAKTFNPQLGTNIENNKILSVNGVGYNYDLSGNVTADGAHFYTYDAEGRQTQVDSGSTAINVYDSSNRRVKKSAGGVTTHYVWEGDQVIAEYNGSTGALTAEYIYAGGTMLARETGSVLRYYHQDRLSTRLITDSTGNVVGTEDHLPFGEDAGVAGESEKHRFTSYERDSESGLDYAVNRQHQYTNGRFMQPDPVQGSINNPQTLNRYSYAMNNPVNLTDPSGLYVGLPFNWIWDASLPGPGVYLDGIQMPREMWGLVFGLVRAGAADIILGYALRVVNLGTIPGNDGANEGSPVTILGYEIVPLIDNSLAYQIIDCDQKLADIFGGEGAVGGDHGTYPGRKQSNPIEAQKAHVYPSKDGSGKTDVYVPAGYDYGVWVGKDNSTAYFYYGKKGLFGQQNVTLLVQHLGNKTNFEQKQEGKNGRVRIGTTGGMQDGAPQGPNYQHIHIEVFRGKGLPALDPKTQSPSQQKARNNARIPYRDIFCK